MENLTINLGIVAEVAEALQDLNEQMVFVGGATVSLYTDDTSAGEIRPTGDIDMTVRISYSYSEWAKVEARLSELGFKVDPFGHALCSYKYKQIPVDIMLSRDGHMGPSNKWYKVGFDNLKKVKVLTQEVYILSAPCFLATKFEAWNDRGKDFRTSNDFEDIIYVLNNRIDIVKEVSEDNLEVRQYIQAQLKAILDHTSAAEMLSCHIHPFVMEERLPILKEKIDNIIELK